MLLSDQRLCLSVSGLSISRLKSSLVLREFLFLPCFLVSVVERKICRLSIPALVPFRGVSHHDQMVMDFGTLILVQCTTKHDEKCNTKIHHPEDQRIVYYNFQHSVLIQLSSYVE